MKDILQYFHYRTTIYLGIAIGFLQTVPSSYGFFSSSPEKPPARIGYLAYQSPRNLGFMKLSHRPIVANFFTLEAKDNSIAPVPTVPVSDPDNSFPLISYGEDNNQSSPTYEIPLVDQVGDSYLEPALPPNDPFVSTDLPEPNLDNTDELMEILESDMRGSNRQLRTRVDFVPPYTMDGGI